VKAPAKRVAADQRRLQDARDQHAESGGIGRAREVTGEGERCHHRQVEQDRCRRSRRETMQSVENAAPQGDQCDQQKIGERDAGEMDRKRELLRLMREAGGENLDDLRREQQRQRE